MKLFIIKLGSQPIEYNGKIPFDFQDAGIDWFFFQAISTIDAERQLARYLNRNHPLQDEINQICRTLRILAAESEDKARTYFAQRYPITRPSSPPAISQFFTLKLEAIGLESQRFIRNVTYALGEDYKPRRAWVAEIIGFDPKYKYKRIFLKHQTDYSEARSAGDRGVYFIYELRPGPIYEVNKLLSWKAKRRYYCRVVNGELVEIDEKEVEECLKKSGLA